MSHAEKVEAKSEQVRLHRLHSKKSASKTLFSLLCYGAVVSFLAFRLHRHLPSPTATDVNLNSGLPEFNEDRAMTIIRRLSDPDQFGYRIVGTKELQDSADYLHEHILKMKAELEASELSQMHDMEVFRLV